MKGPYNRASARGPQFQRAVTRAFWPATALAHSRRRRRARYRRYADGAPGRRGTSGARPLQGTRRDRGDARLQVPPELIQTWINGHATMPERKFLRLVDVLDEIGDKP